ncbi:MAG TPA: hypothetical protein VNH20_05265 [Candidatus Dormibacteraeota bacterium]|nr:hypothetical protein [Candidatus Dormibacteraeota bacterium]
MTTIAAEPRRWALPLPFEEGDPTVATSRRTALPRSLVAWLLLPALAALVCVGVLYAAQTAQATALTYQIASLRAAKAQLLATQDQQLQQLQQLQSAGQVAASAGHLGMTPPPTWTVVSPPPAAASDPLTPVIIALRGG